MDTESPRLRLSILGIVVFSLFAALFVRLWYLQVMATDQGEVEAANNRVRTIQEEPPRGRILDAKGHVLVDNRTSLVVTIDPHGLQELETDTRNDMLLRLATELTQSGVPTKVATIERRLDDPQYSPLQPIPVAIDVPDDLMVFLAERADEFPSVQVRRETVRHYPEGSLAAHVVGYVGRISAPELEARMGTREEPKAHPKPYEPDSDIGKTGIEKTFEDDLRGVPGLVTVEVDAHGQVKNEIGRTKPIPGNDVQLTIDIDLQRSTEERLAYQLESMRGTYTRDGKLVQGKAGSAVVVDPRNGGVLAMASYPTYDPSEFVNGISTDRYQQLVGGDVADNPLINRAIAGLYAPGSTFKLVTAYAALSKGMITGDTGYQDNGIYTTGTGTFRNAGETAHGWVDLPQAITVSSDVYFYHLGDVFWKERDKYKDGIQEAARQFGFGEATGVQLPGELGGVVPDPAWKKQLWDSLPEEQKLRDADKWYAGDNVNMAIGQGDVLATPLQIANAYATFGAGGVRHQTTLVAKVVKPGGDPNDPAAVVRTIDPVVVATVPMPPEYFDPLRDGLGGVTSAKDGTATLLFEGFDQSEFPIMGKTGTAEVKGKADTSIFVGVAPADNPTYSVLAILEQAGFGSDAAGPVVRGIFEHASGQDLIVDPCAPPTPGSTNTTSTTTPGTAPVTCPTDPTYGAGGTGYTDGTIAPGNPAYTETTAWTPPPTSYVAPTTPYTTPSTQSTVAPTVPSTTPSIPPTSGAPPTSAAIPTGPG